MTRSGFCNPFEPLNMMMEEVVVVMDYPEPLRQIVTQIAFDHCDNLINSFPEIQFKPLNFILEIHRCHLSREGENKIDI